VAAGFERIRRGRPGLAGVQSSADLRPPSRPLQRASVGRGAR
jgi:hypothetical protein